MPVYPTIIPDLDLAVVRYQGTISLADIQRAFGEYISHTLYRPGRTEIGDLSGVTRVDIDFGAMTILRNQLIEHHMSLGVRTDCHLIAPNDLAFGMARMFQTLSDATEGNLSVRVHRSPDELLDIVGHSKQLSQLLGHK